MYSLKKVIVPKNLNELFKIFSENHPYKLLAGGTDLIIQIKKKKVAFEELVDISNIAELKQVGFDLENIYIGSAVTFTQILDSEIIQEKATALCRAAAAIGSPQIRNRATLGGNIANNSPAADSVTALLVLKAKVVIKSPYGMQEIGLEELINRTPQLESNQIITEIIIPIKNNTVSTVRKLGRRNALTISRINCAINIALENEIIIDSKVGFGAVAKHPFLSKSIEKYLNNKTLSEVNLEELVQLASVEVKDSLRARPSSMYKCVAVQGLLFEAFQDLYKGYEHGSI